MFDSGMPAHTHTRGCDMCTRKHTHRRESERKARTRECENFVENIFVVENAFVVDNFSLSLSLFLPLSLSLSHPATLAKRRQKARRHERFLMRLPGCKAARSYLVLNQWISLLVNLWNQPEEPCKTP